MNNLGKTKTKIDQEEKKHSKDRLEQAQEDLNTLTDYLEDLSSFLPLSICAINPAGIIISVNRALEKLSGFVSNEMVGSFFEDMFLEKKRIKELFKIVVKEKRAKHRELTLITKEGERIPVSISLSAREDRGGFLRGYFASITDISDLKKIQEQIEEKVRERTKELERSRKALLNMLEDTEAAKLQIEKEKIRTQIILDNFLDGLLIFDFQNRLILVNPKAEEFLNVKQKEILGRTITGLERYSRAKEIAKIIEKGGKKVFREEVAFGEKLVVEVTTQPILSPIKGKTDLLVILHDITREKVIDRLKSQFVSVAAHQLRTPLSIIKWSLSMLLEGDLGPVSKEQKDILLKTNQTNERMIRLVNDLLNVARIEEGRFVYHPKTVDFAELLQAVIDPLRLLAKKKKIDFRVEIAESKKSKIVKVDTEKISLTIKNLVENAIFYTDPGGKVMVSLKRKGHRIEFSVKDTGIGIPKDQQNRVFSKFFRGNNAVRKETEGTGLGLFIAKNIIEAHKGKIWFKSTEGKGTTFFFALPTID